MSKRFSILLCGAFGYGNFGDNLLRDVAVDLFRSTFPKIDVYVDRPHPNTKLIEEVDLRVIGPGGLLYEGDSIHEDYYKQYAKKPFILFGTGFSIHNKEEIKSDGLCDHLIKNADLIISRHQKDLEYIEHICKRDNVFIYPDIGFFCNPSKFYKTYKEDKPNILFCPGQLTIFTEEDKQKYKKLVKECNITRLISLSVNGNDLIDHLRIAISDQKTTSDYYFDSFKTICSLISESDLFITGRFHGAILGILLGKKVVILPRKDGQIEPKLSYLNCPIIDWEQLKNNPKEYINSITIITEVEGYNIDDIRMGRINIMKPIIKYMKEKFNIEAGY